MSQALNLKILGLYTHPNVLSEAPTGALSVADNVVINRESIASTRRGFKQYKQTAATPGSPLGSPPHCECIDRLMEFDDNIIAHYGSTMAYDIGAGFVEYTGTYDHPDSTHKMRRVEANKNFYFNTDEGVKKIDAITSEPIPSGAPRGLGGTGALSGSSGFMANDTAVAYRVVWGYYDANNILILGTPSQRLVVTNSSGGTRDVALTFTIPSDVTADWLYFIYRSGESATAADVPDDELQLVYEDNPTAGEITAKVFTVTDTTLDELKGGALYTNQSQQTILQTNDRPPFCVDMASYKEHIFYANTSTAHRYTFAIISVGTGSPATTTALTIDDTITIAGITYTGKATESAANEEFLVDSSGTPSQNIDATAISLIRVINTSPNNSSVYAYYLSGFEDIPGKILIEERGIGGSEFYMNSSKSTCWSPRLPEVGSPADTSEASDNESKDNRIYISKKQQPEAVPLVNWIDVGNEHDPIDRVIALRDSVMVFKADGIFRITGTTLPFSVYPFNNSVEVRGLETAVVLDNRIFTMSDQGVVAIGDSGVEILSRNIERSLVSLTAEQYTNFNTSFALSYESERMYVLFTVTDEDDLKPTQAYVYNTVTGAWTRWDVGYTSGLVKESDDKIYLGHKQNGYVYQERKSLTRDDYADEEYAFNITGAGSPIAASTTVMVDDSTNLVEGMTIQQREQRAVIITVDSGTEITVDEALEWYSEAATGYVPIHCAIEWTPQFAENPGITKQWREATFMFDDASFRAIDCTIRSNFFGGVTYELLPLDAGLGAVSSWGNGVWGPPAWGGDDAELAGANLIRTLIPADAQRSHWLYIRLDLNQAFATFAVAGVSLMFNNVGSRMR